MKHVPVAGTWTGILSPRAYIKGGIGSLTIRPRSSMGLYRDLAKFLKHPTLVQGFINFCRIMLLYCGNIFQNKDAKI